MQTYKLYCTPGGKWSGTQADFKADFRAEFGKPNVRASEIDEGTLQVPYTKFDFIAWAKERDLYVTQWRVQNKGELIDYLNRMEVRRSANEVAPPPDVPEKPARFYREPPAPAHDPDFQSRVAEALASTEPQQGRRVTMHDVKEFLAGCGYAQASLVQQYATEAMVTNLAHSLGRLPKFRTGEKANV